MRPSKDTSLGQSASFEASCVQNISVIWFVRRVTKKRGKVKVKYLCLYLTYMWSRPQSTECYHFLQVQCSCRHYKMCKISERSGKRFLFGEYLIMACSHRKAKSSLTLCSALMRLHVMPSKFPYEILHFSAECHLVEVSETMRHCKRREKPTRQGIGLRYCKM
jgi:hypothetical protein